MSPVINMNKLEVGVENHAICIHTCGIQASP